MFQSGVLVFISIEVEGKAPDLRHVSVSSSRKDVDLDEFGRRASEFMRESDQVNEDAVYKVVSTYQYSDMKELNKLVERQIDEFIHQDPKV